MPSVQIKDVPDDAHRVLRMRAAAAHQSLQEYLRTRLIAEANRPTIDEAMSAAARNADGDVGFDQVAAILRDDRDRR